MERFIFDTSSHTLVCGILNITPDSFSDGGKWDEPQKALEHALEMQALGADIIDVGAIAPPRLNKALRRRREREAHSGARSVKGQDNRSDKR